MDLKLGGKKVLIAGASQGIDQGFADIIGAMAKRRPNILV
jgi:hypothetical protein